MSLIRINKNFNLDKLYSRPRCHVVWKVFSISKNTVVVVMILFKWKVTWFAVLIHWSFVLTLSTLLSSMCLWTIFRITFSNSLPVVDKRLIGLKFWANLGSYHLSVTLQILLPSKALENGSRKKWLIRRVRCANGLLGKYLRHSGDILSGPQAFLSFDEFANLHMLKCLTFLKRESCTDASRFWTLVTTFIHGVHHTGHEMWSGFLNNPQLRWFSFPCDTSLLVKSSIMLRPPVSRPLGLGIKHSSGAYDLIFNLVRQLRICWGGALSLTRERVCRFQLLLVLASVVILESESRGTSDHILLFQIREFSSPRIRRAAMEIFDPSFMNILLPLDTYLRSKLRFQQYFYCCMLIYCCGDTAQIVSVGNCSVCEARYSVTAVVYLHLSRSLPRNECSFGAVG
jgi:hypothetical protein